MDFSINKHSLSQALTALHKTAPARTTLPILSSVLIQATTDNKITFRSTDLELEMKMQVEGKVLKEGEVCAPIQKLNEIAHTITEEEVSINVNEACRMRIKNNTGTYLVACKTTEEFPEERKITTEPTNIETGFLLKTIKETVYATSKDELKPTLNGVFFNFSSTDTTAVATDGHRLVKFTHNQKNKKACSALVPQKFLNTIEAGNINVREANLRVYENYIEIETDTEKLSTRLISDPFPDYESVIPTDNPNNTTVNTQTLLGATKRVALMSNKTTKQIVLQIQQNKIKIAAEDHETGGSATDEVIAEHQGTEITIGFNAGLLLEILKHQKTEEIDILTNTPLSAALIKEKGENKNTTTLLMPIRI